LIPGVGVLAAGLLFVWQLYERLDGTIRDAYAQEWVASMVIGYMETHENRWPRDWDDLQEPYERDVAKVGRPWSFQQLRDRVDVDFSADLSALAATTPKDGQPPFRVIRLRSGRKSHWESHEANSMILGYLRNSATGPGAVEPHVE
jgi:hypothetical protein